MIYEDEILEWLCRPGRNQLAREEYKYIAQFLGNKHFLVFGSGEDSNYWRLKNINGKTIFLESDDFWIDKKKSDIIKVKYQTTLHEADSLLKHYLNNNFEKLTLELPPEITNSTWDAIFVDSPSGYSPNCHGRMQSMYVASVLCSAHTEVFVHDINRKIEHIFTNTIFKKTIHEFLRLRHVRLMH